MTATDRPPVTDNARAVRGAAMDLYRALRRTNPDALAEVDEVEDWTYWENIVRAAQVALAADRPSTDQALAEAWAEGHRTGWEHCQDGNYGNDHWDDPTPNPYAAADRAETTTATTDEAVGELLERMSDAVTQLEALRAEHREASECQRLHGKIEGVKLAASYVEEARGLLATARSHPTLDDISDATEDAARVLDDVIQHLRKIWSTGHDEAREVIDTAEELLAQALPRLTRTGSRRSCSEPC